MDEPAGAAAKAVVQIVGHGRVKDLLSGSGLGHPLHPLLTDIPIGTVDGRRRIPRRVPQPQPRRRRQQRLPSAPSRGLDRGSRRGAARRHHPVQAVAGDATVLLYRSGAHIHAIGRRCSHAGGPLDEGEVDAASCTATCPWHQSVFRLQDGSVVHGPASVPQAAYDARIQAGRVEVRVRQ
jgi:nitrite reductase/ring-hydroxylating ferredoxin subunit